MRINFKNVLLIISLIVFLVFLPVMVKSEYLINCLLMFFLYVTIAQSWNLLGGFTGQISLGHSAFFGMGALITRFLWLGKIPILLALVGGGISSALLAGMVGIPCLRMRSAYFPIGTLALALIAGITVGNILPVPGSLSREYILEYDIYSRYYLALPVAVFTVLVVYCVVYSRTGMAIIAIREDEGAAAALGVKTFGYKVLSLMISSFLAGLGGGIFAYQYVSYYYDSPFELSWAFLPTLTTFIGGLGTIVGPIVGSMCFLALSEIFAISLGEVHVLIFGFTFILIVLFLPGGLMSIAKQSHKRINIRGKKFFKHV